MKLTLLAGVCALATAMPAEALNQPLDFYSNTGSWSGSITGPHISAGDTLALNYRTYDDVGFSIRPGDQVFATVSFKEMGLRVVDYSWAFYNHGSLIVDERAQLDVPVEGSMLTTRIFANFTGVFDVFTWTVLLDSSESEVSSLFALAFSTTATPVSNPPPVSAVPLPGAAVLFGSALLGFFLRRSRGGAVAA
jgi:hypothetical protein